MANPICSSLGIQFCFVMYFSWYYLFPLFVFRGNICVAKVLSDPIWKSVSKKLKIPENYDAWKYCVIDHNMTTGIFLFNDQFIKSLIYRILELSCLLK